MPSFSRGFRFGIFAAALWFGAIPVWAWGPLGHKIVGRIAQDRLSPQARAAVQGLLAPGVGLEQIANCADTVKYATAPFACAGVFTMDPKDFKGTGPWHFIDIPLSANPAASNVVHWCPNGKDCVTEQIKIDAEVLANPQSSLADKRVALMFVTHFVGDLHQPLHCADDHDQGGNKKNVVFMGVTKRLHELWDDMILPEKWQVQATENPEPWVKSLETDLAKRKTAAWTSGDWIDDAALESHAIAKNVIYPQYAQNHGQNLGRVYQRAMTPIVRLRLEMAGARLAVLLNQAFNPKQN